MIAAGTASLTIMSAITERETRIPVITDKLVEPGPDSLQERLDEICTLAVERVQQGGKITFEANGKIDFFGENRRTAGVVEPPGSRNRSSLADSRVRCLI